MRSFFTRSLGGKPQARVLQPQVPALKPKDQLYQYTQAVRVEEKCCQAAVLLFLFFLLFLLLRLLLRKVQLRKEATGSSVAVVWCMQTISFHAGSCRL